MLDPERWERIQDRCAEDAECEAAEERRAAERARNEGLTLPLEHPVVDIAASEQLLCALTAAPAIQCWEVDGERVARLAPFSLEREALALDVGGAGVGCLVGPDREVECWLAEDAHPTDGTELIRVRPTRGARDVVVGMDGACAIGRSGHASCWSTSDLVDGETIGAVPVEGLGPVASLAIHQHACALQTDGEVYCWGEDNAYGELGSGGSDPVRGLVPVSGVSGARAVVAHADRSGVLGDGGEWIGWGNWHYAAPPRDGDFGPVRLPGVRASRLALAKDLTCVAWDGHWTCFGGMDRTGIEAMAQPAADPLPFAADQAGVTTTGFAVCWPDGDDMRCVHWMSGQRGEHRFAHAQAVHGDPPCLLTTDRRVRCAERWWWSGSPELGPPIEGLHDVVQVDRSFTRIAARTSSGDVLHVGRSGGVERLGALRGALQIAHSGTTCGLMPGGRVVCGERAMALPEAARSLAAGDGHTCALLESGSVYCWGSSPAAGVGRLDDAFSFTPHPVGVQGATVIASAPRHACAIVADSEVVCWGSPLKGVFGRIPRRAFLTPTRITSASR